jgi:hypothetical protein
MFIRQRKIEENRNKNENYTDERNPNKNGKRHEEKMRKRKSVNIVTSARALK